MGVIEALSPDDMREVAACLSSSIHLGDVVLEKTLGFMSDRRKKAEAAASLMQYAQERPFTFLGDATDLSWFWSNQSVPLQQIAALEAPRNEEIMATFKQYQADGLVELREGGFWPTEKCGEKIYDPNYIEQVVQRENKLKAQALDAVKGKKHPGAGTAAKTSGTVTTEKAGSEAVGKAAKAVTRGTVKAASGGTALAAEVVMEVVKKGAKVLTNQAHTLK